MLIYSMLNKILSLSFHCQIIFYNVLLVLMKKASHSRVTTAIMTSNKTVGVLEDPTWEETDLSKENLKIGLVSTSKLSLSENVFVIMEV